MSACEAGPPLSDPLVIAALGPLASAEDLPPVEQLAVFAAAHQALQAALDAEVP